MQLRITSNLGRGDELLAALMEIDASLRDEETCLFHLVGRTPDDEGALIVVEAWTDRSAHESWRARPSTEALVRSVRACALGPPEVVEVRWHGGKGMPSS